MDSDLLDDSVDMTTTNTTSSLVQDPRRIPQSYRQHNTPGSSEYSTSLYQTAISGKPEASLLTGSTGTSSSSYGNSQTASQSSSGTNSLFETNNTATTLSATAIPPMQTVRPVPSSSNDNDALFAQPEYHGDSAFAQQEIVEPAEDSLMHPHRRLSSPPPMQDFSMNGQDPSLLSNSIGTSPKHQFNSSLISSSGRRSRNSPRPSSGTHKRHEVSNSPTRTVSYSVTTRQSDIVADSTDNSADDDSSSEHTPAQNPLNEFFPERDDADETHLTTDSPPNLAQAISHPPVHSPGKASQTPSTIIQRQSPHTQTPPFPSPSSNPSTTRIPPSPAQYPPPTSPYNPTSTQIPSPVVEQLFIPASMSSTSERQPFQSPSQQPEDTHRSSRPSSSHSRHSSHSQQTSSQPRTVFTSSQPSQSSQAPLTIPPFPSQQFTDRSITSASSLDTPPSAITPPQSIQQEPLLDSSRHSDSLQNPTPSLQGTRTSLTPAQYPIHHTKFSIQNTPNGVVPPVVPLRTYPNTQQQQQQQQQQTPTTFSLDQSQSPFQRTSQPQPETRSFSPHRYHPGQPNQNTVTTQPTRPAQVIPPFPDQTLPTVRMYQTPPSLISTRQPEIPPTPHSPSFSQQTQSPHLPPQRSSFSQTQPIASVVFPVKPSSHTQPIHIQTSPYTQSQTQTVQPTPNSSLHTMSLHTQPSPGGYTLKQSPISQQTQSSSHSSSFLLTTSKLLSQPLPEHFPPTPDTFDLHPTSPSLPSQNSTSVQTSTDSTPPDNAKLTAQSPVVSMEKPQSAITTPAYQPPQQLPAPPPPPTGKRSKKNKKRRKDDSDSSDSSDSTNTSSSSSSSSDSEKKKKRKHKSKKRKSKSPHPTSSATYAPLSFAYNYPFTTPFCSCFNNLPHGAICPNCGRVKSPFIKNLDAERAFPPEVYANPQKYLFQQPEPSQSRPLETVSDDDEYERGRQPSHKELDSKAVHLKKKKKGSKPKGTKKIQRPIITMKALAELIPSPSVHTEVKSNHAKWIEGDGEDAVGSISTTTIRSEPSDLIQQSDLTQPSLSHHSANPNDSSVQLSRKSHHSQQLSSEPKKKQEEEYATDVGDYDGWLDQFPSASSADKGQYASFFVSADWKRQNKISDDLVWKRKKEMEERMKRREEERQARIQREQVDRNEARREEEKKKKARALERREYLAQPKPSSKPVHPKKKVEQQPRPNSAPRGRQMKEQPENIPRPQSQNPQQPPSSNEVTHETVVAEPVTDDGWETSKEHNEMMANLYNEMIAIKKMLIQSGKDQEDETNSRTTSMNSTLPDSASALLNQSATTEYDAERHKDEMIPTPMDEQEPSAIPSEGSLESTIYSSLPNFWTPPVFVKDARDDEEKRKEIADKIGERQSQMKKLHERLRSEERAEREERERQAKLERDRKKKELEDRVKLNKQKAEQEIEKRANDVLKREASRGVSAGRSQSAPRARVESRSRSRSAPRHELSETKRKKTITKIVKKKKKVKKSQKENYPPGATTFNTVSPPPPIHRI